MAPGGWGVAEGEAQADRPHRLHKCAHSLCTLCVRMVYQ